MGFLNNISKKTSETTNKIAKETKLKMKINENKGKIKELYEVIGKTVYENHIMGQDKSIKDDCTKIDELSKEIEQARKEILILNHRKMCKECYAEIEEDDMFCPKCGKKQTDENTTFEKAEEKLENEEISPEKAKEAQIVKEELQEKNESNQ